MTNQVIYSSGIFPSEPFGPVKVTVRSQSRRITGRWNSGRLEVSVPRGLKVTELESALDHWKREHGDSWSAAGKGRGFYHMGQCLDFDWFSVYIERAMSLESGRIRVSPMGGDRYAIMVSRDLDMSDPQVSKNITTMLERIARISGGACLIEQARGEAERLSVYPTGWEVGRGHRVLGTCNSRGIIKLSACLCFMPGDLRRLIICHELAHLSELNHSEQFHAILDRYVNGQEKELNRRLRAFKWPVFY